MFNTYSESARRVIFFARIEAGRLRYDSIDVQHLLLGVIREDRAGDDGQTRQEYISNESDELRSADPICLPRRQTDNPFLERDAAGRLRSTFSVFGSRSEGLPTDADMPLTEGARKVLYDASEYANGSTVSLLHLLWAMLVDPESSVSKGLVENGITRERIENEIRRREGR